jgi:hypothetical protein
MGGRHAPVMTVPWPRTLKQWSTMYSIGTESEITRLGMCVAAETASISSEMPSDGTLSAKSAAAAEAAAPDNDDAASEDADLPGFAAPAASPTDLTPPTDAEMAMMGALANFVLAMALRMFCRVFSTRSSRSASSMRSILFRTITACSQVMLPITRHSAVCVWMPRMTSITSSIMSMICAPPMMVRISEAWPGQSMRVYCTASTSGPAASRRWAGRGTR